MSPLPVSTPSALGIDPAGVSAFVDALESTAHIEPHSLMLLRHGQVAAQGWWAPYAADRVHLLYSLSKSFTAAAVGIAVDERRIDLDRTVLSYFPELEGDVTDERSRRILVRHLLAMASGHREETQQRARDIDPDNTVRGFLMVPPDDEPGTVFAYNQPCTYTLGAIVRRVTGESLLDYLRTWLLDPLGIDQASWTVDSTGAELGYSGLHSTTEAVAKLGQLYLQGGVWEGRRLLSEEWVAAATSKHIDNFQEGKPDWSQGYGYQFWIARHGYRGDGAFGQFCVVLPELDVVLAMTGQSLDMQAVLDAAWTHLLPAISADSLAASPVSPELRHDTGQDAALASRLAALVLPPVTGDPVDDLPIGSFTPGDGNDLPDLHEVHLSVATDGTFELALLEGSDLVEAAIDLATANGSWTVSGPTAVSVAWRGETIAVDVAFLETPHRLHLLLDPVASTFVARGAAGPMWALLAELRAP